MKVLILEGSPRIKGNSSILCDEFERGAIESGCDVEKIHITRKKIGGCLGCDACQRNGGNCIQKDDMQSIYPEILVADMIVFASPIYYFTLSAQLQAVIHRTYSIDIPKNVKKTALIMSSGSAYVYGPAIAQYYQSIVEYWGVENAGIFTANSDQNFSQQKREELYNFAKMV